MRFYDRDETEALRAELLREVTAAGFAGLPAMLLDEDEIRRADSETLKEIARRYGR